MRKIFLFLLLLPFCLFGGEYSSELYTIVNYLNTLNQYNYQYIPGVGGITTVGNLYSIKNYLRDDFDPKLNHIESYIGQICDDIGNHINDGFDDDIDQLQKLKTIDTSLTSLLSAVESLSSDDPHDYSSSLDSIVSYLSSIDSNLSSIDSKLPDDLHSSGGGDSDSESHDYTDILTSLSTDLNTYVQKFQSMPEDLWDKVTEYFDSGIDMGGSHSLVNTHYFTYSGSSSVNHFVPPTNYNYWKGLFAQILQMRVLDGLSLDQDYFLISKFVSLYDSVIGNKTSFYSDSDIFRDYSFADISFESNALPQQVDYSLSSSDFFQSALRLLALQARIGSSETMFLKHILETMPGADSVDTAPLESELQNSLDQVSAQLDSLSQALDFSGLKFSDSTTVDSHFSTSDFSDVFSNGMIGTIVLDLPAVDFGSVSFGGYQLNISLSSLMPFLDVSRACFRVFYWLLLASLLWFVFRLFTPFVVGLFNTVKTVFNW